MTFITNRNLVRWTIILVSFITISLILWNTYIFFQNFKDEERSKMQNWSFAQKELSKPSNLDINIGELPLVILKSNTTTPMINVSANGRMNFNNINEDKAKDTLYLQTLIKQFKNENEPIEIRSNGKVLSTLYYGNSPLLNKLKYYPLALLLIIFLFVAVAYFFYRSTKNAEQNKLWTGMAKETAHQIGTPLSSLIGWTEILRSEDVNPDYIKEIEKDIDRLLTITDRFSKIGSIPTLKKCDIIAETFETYDYLKARSSKLIDFEIVTPNMPLYVNLNKQLYSWTIENLVKNAIDAMKGKGKLTLNIVDDHKYVKIMITDNGKGLPNHLHTKI